ncbi:hypothetical protein ACFLZK_00455 [Patescibacteria group bacterium]
MSKYSKKERKQLKKQRQSEINEKSVSSVKKVVSKEKQIPYIKKIIKGNRVFIVILLIICFALYANTLDNQLTLVDDMQAFVFYPLTKDLWGSLKTLNIQQTLYAISYQLFEFNPLPIRIVSVLVHMYITVLVFLFTYLVWNKKIAQISSLIFAVHAINTEAVTWISGAPYLYYALFTFTILILYVLYFRGRGNKFLYIAAIIYVVEMVIMRSPWVLVSPMALVVLDQLILRRKFSLNKLWWIILFAIPVSIYLMIYFEDAYIARLEARSGGGTRVTLHTQALKPVTEGYPYSTYLMSKLYVFPKNLSVYYDGMEVNTALYVSMYTAFILYLATVVYTLVKNRQIAGILIMLPVLMAPAYSPIKITWFLAERYLYSGTAFVGVLVAMGILWLDKKYKNKYISYGVLGLILIVLSIRTVVRNEDWQDTETLSYANMKSSPLSVRPYNDMGGHFYYNGEVMVAVDWYEKALKVVPTSGTAINNLGYLYFELGPLLFWEELEWPEPNEATANSLFSQALSITKEGGDARTTSYFLNKSIVFNPNNVDTVLYTADFYRSMDFIDDARNLYIYAMRADPGNEYAVAAINGLSNY